MGYMRKPDHPIKWMKPVRQKSKHVGKDPKSKPEKTRMPMKPPLRIYAANRPAPSEDGKELLDAEGFHILCRK